MRLIYDVKDISSRRSPKAAAQWTALVPAAGRATRLAAATPKILYPVLGKPILGWLADLLKPLCGRFVFVLSPEGAPQIDPLLKRALGERSETVVQREPTGMADAVALGEAAVKTECTLVLWGDQITPRRETLAACMTLLESSASIHAVLPTIQRKDPYIHFVRDAEERIIEVFEARESDERPGNGESDCGAFFFRTEALFRVLRESRGNPAYQGAKTKERNFLCLLPLFHDARGSLTTVRLHDPDESVGINSPADAEEAGRILKGRSA